MKKPESFLKEYARNLSDDHLYGLNQRFSHNLCGDREAVALILQNNHTIDKWLCGATAAIQWFDMVDLVGDSIKQEVERRSSEREREKRESRESRFRPADKEVIEV